MQKVKFFIKGFDEASNSLLISFASDATQSSDPATYEACAFQPGTMWPDVTDVEELKRRIAVAGMYHAEAQARKERMTADPERQGKLKALVGQTYEFSVAELTRSADDQTPFQVV